MSDDGIRKVADALSKTMARAEVEAELRSLGQKLHAIKRAVDVVYRALEGWTGEDLKPGDPIPIVRNGIMFGWTPHGHVTASDVREVAEASLIEETSDIRRRIKSLEALIQSAADLISAVGNLSILEQDGLERLSSNHNHNALRGLKPVTERIVREIGSLQAALISCNALLEAAGSTIEELETKLEERKSGRGRPRNEAAHEVALRLARLYSRVTGRRPTYSAGPDGLSGDFTPVLRDVFDALGWEKVDLRGPAEKAVAGVRESDINAEENGLKSLINAWPGEFTQAD